MKTDSQALQRLLFLLILLLVLPLGLATRKFGEYFPEFIATYGGDTLWATAVFLMFRIVFIRQKTAMIALYALIFAFLIEISQLYSATWLNTIRDTTFGALVLGKGFLWSDFICYTAGVGIGCIIDKSVKNGLKKM